LHSAHWRQASSYVALTRQRESVAIFAATETAVDVGQLARQMSRREVRAASVAWATRDELPPRLRPEAKLRPEAGQGERTAPEARAGRAGPGERVATVRGDGALSAPSEAPPKPRPIAAASGSASGPASGSKPSADAPAAPRWLIAPRVVAEGVDAAERSAAVAVAGAVTVAAVVAADPAVRREREALGQYLAGAYRDPRAAEARLAELVATHGVTSAARRIEADPEQLGALAGRTGLLAGRTARAARLQAERVVQAVGPALRRIGAAEAAAVQGTLAGIEALRAAEATGVPMLSVQAQEAVRALGAADAPGERARAWAALQADDRTAVEVAGFVRAVEGRLGAEAVRLMDRHGTEAAEAIGVRDQGTPRATLADIGWVVQAVRHGERAAASEGHRLAAGERIGQGPRMRP